MAAETKISHQVASVTVAPAAAVVIRPSTGRYGGGGSGGGTYACRARFVTVRPLSRMKLQRGHVRYVRRSGGCGVVDAYGPASLLLGLELLVL